MAVACRRHREMEVAHDACDAARDRQAGPPFATYMTRPYPVWCPQLYTLSYAYVEYSCTVDSAGALAAAPAVPGPGP